MSDCPEPTELSRLLASPDDAPDEGLRAHVAGCSACAERSARLSELLRFPASAEPPAHVLPALLRQIEEQLASDLKSQEVPAMSRDHEEPVAFLGGQTAHAPEPELPALPPAGVSAVYSASDFIAAPEVAAPDDADLEGERASAPLEAAPVEAAPAESDFESYAAEPEAAAELATETVEDAVEDPALPRTISQQDAEALIRRITTKAELPEAPPILPPAEPLTRRPGLRLGRTVGLVAGLLVLVGGAVAFRDELIVTILGGKAPEPEVVAATPLETREQVLENKLRARVLESEWRAFGYASLAEFEAGQKSDQGHGPTPHDGGK